MSRPTAKVAIVGGGINGFSCGVNILQSIPNTEVTILAEVLPPNTTGDNAAGLIFPFAINETKMESVLKWVKETIAFCNQLSLTGDAAEAGIFPQSGFYVVDDDDNALQYKDILLTFDVISAENMKVIMPSINSKAAFATTYVMEGEPFLAWLKKRFRRYGGNVQQVKIHSLSELSSKYDVIVNCTGMGAKELVPDNEVFPVRGQVIKVKAPFIKHFFIDQRNDLTMSYIIPTSETVTVGGTAQKGNYNVDVDFSDKKRIMDGACRMIPNLKNCTYIRDWVGLRPGRRSVRLEKETMHFNGKRISVIHNYGHGGAGLTLSWGCAKDVVALMKQDIANKISSRL
ncbi:D-aspartate oxidase-like [Antedon mediterranea]|uniref:D-aspartate oxidase-like n=1 Tax=Antedon mediterranea TaxID=105859 RepID=UPI003AF58AA7